MGQNLDFQLERLFSQIQSSYSDLRSNGLHKENLVKDGEDTITSVDIVLTYIAKSHFDSFNSSFYLVSEELGKSGFDNYTEQTASKVEDSNNLEEILEILSWDIHQDSGNIDYTVYLDEIDGTKNMFEDKGPHGPIIGIAEGSNPTYDDIVAAGFLDFGSGDFYEGYKDEGAYKTRNFGRQESEREELSTSKRKKLDEELNLIVDERMLGERPEIVENAEKYGFRDPGCSGYNIGKVSDGNIDALVSGDHSNVKETKTGEEWVLYPVVSEAGGVIVDWNGRDIAEKKIGVEENLGHDIVAASSYPLANQIIKEIVDTK
jgi:fructose-1,6-bisphosphatase/inositol monophosphatase family enzyme